MGKARRRYEDAIAELAAARESMDEQATLLGWLGAGTMSNAARSSGRSS
jgi:hypothetical protein